MKTLAVWLSCAAALVACASPSPPESGRNAHDASGASRASGEADASQAGLEAAWTDAFETASVLLAREVSIEGPPGLVAHFALQQNPRDFDFHAEGTARGFLQESSVKQDLAASAAVSWPPLRAQLDNLMIAASHRIRVLERPELCDVVVAARGEVMWKCLAPEQERRGETLRLVGAVGSNAIQAEGCEPSPATSRAAGPR